MTSVSSNATAARFGLITCKLFDTLEYILLICLMRFHITKMHISTAFFFSSKFLSKLLEGLLGRDTKSVQVLDPSVTSFVATTT